MDDMDRMDLAPGAGAGLTICRRLKRKASPKEERGFFKPRLGSGGRRPPSAFLAMVL
jgi:hypothetical protein